MALNFVLYTETLSVRSSHLLEYGFENQSSRYKQAKQSKYLAPRTASRGIDVLKTI